MQWFTVSFSVAWWEIWEVKIGSAEFILWIGTPNGYPNVSNNVFQTWQVPSFCVIAKIRQNMPRCIQMTSDCKHLESRNSPQMSTKTTSFSCQLGWPVLFSSIGRGVSKRSALITSSLANKRFQCLFLQWKVRLRLLDTFSGICWSCLKVFDDTWMILGFIPSSSVTGFGKFRVFFPLQYCTACTQIS